MAVSRCFQQYTSAIYDYGGMRHNTATVYSEHEFMIVAQDFIIDLLIVIDVLSLLVAMMIRRFQTQR